jgi:hypothetical protein
MSRSTELASAGESRDRGAALLAFFASELPPAMTGEAAYLTNAVLEAGARYDRYSGSKSEWSNYNTRRRRLKEIERQAARLASSLCGLDILSREDLSGRVAAREMDALVGSLRLLEKVTSDMIEEVQESGKPRDLAEERWILALAKIYENAFSEPATAAGSGAKSTRRHRRFYRLLGLSRPESLPQHGKLTYRQVDRTLRRERRRTHGMSDEVMLRLSAKSPDTGVPSASPSDVPAAAER